MPDQSCKSVTLVPSRKRGTRGGGKQSRRQFLQASALLATSVGVFSETRAAATNSPNAKLNLGAIGVGNRGMSNVFETKSENLVALCDVDERYLGQMLEHHPRAATYRDFRKLLERRDLDAVVISTPDHTHVHPAVRAMRDGRHVYCEKPLAHSVAEVRWMARVASESRVATQMGNQHHSSAGYRRAAELVQSGAIGPVREVHSWTNRPFWPQGIERPREVQPVPRHLDWELWLGPAPARPYADVYHPLKWRGWWDFGTGALGDMGPHLIDPAFAALRLSLPTVITPLSSPVNDETAPLWSIVRFDFPARESLPPVALTWYDGDKQPPSSVTGFARLPPNGTMLMGERAKLFVPELGGSPIVIPRERGDKIESPESRVPESPGHHAEWIEACKTGGSTSSAFPSAALLTETCLLGNIAIRVGQPLQWNARKGEFTNCEEANRYLRREYREGWEAWEPN